MVGEFLKDWFGNKKTAKYLNCLAPGGKMIVNFIFYPFERKKYDISITIPFKKGIYEIKNLDNPQIIEKIDDN